MEVDVDSEIDQNLLQQFSCMNTQDRDTLISQFQILLGNQINAGTCRFFLDMNNWNLQEAVCAYFDLESTRDNAPSMTILQDVIVANGGTFRANTRFTKTWRIQNSGGEAWPSGCVVKYVQGDRLSGQDQVLLHSLSAQEIVDITVDLVSPHVPGTYAGQWRVHTTEGAVFGDVMLVNISVRDDVSEESMAADMATVDSTLPVTAFISADGSSQAQTVNPFVAHNSVHTANTSYQSTLQLSYIQPPSDVTSEGRNPDDAMEAS